MDGQAHWLDGAVLLVGGAIVFSLVAFSVRIGQRLVREWRRLVCPTSGAPADCLVTRDTGSGELTDVEACSAAPSPLRCAKGCLRQADRPLRAV